MKPGRQEPGSFKDTHWGETSIPGEAQPELSDISKQRFMGTLGARKLVWRQLSPFQSGPGRRRRIERCPLACIPAGKESIRQSLAICSR